MISKQVFKSWNNKVELNMPGLWDARMRRFHGQRFDSRAGAFDWDYQQVIKPGAGVIHSRIYRDWRESGVAFEFGDQTYTQPNRSLASYAVGREGGMSKQRRGFWGDIRMGPFVSFGVDCPLPNDAAKGLFKLESKGTGCEQYRHTTVHVAVYHLISLLYEIETGKAYLMKKENDIYSGLGHDELLEKGVDMTNERQEGEEEEEPTTTAEVKVVNQTNEGNSTAEVKEVTQKNEGTSTAEVKVAEQTNEGTSAAEVKDVTPQTSEETSTAEVKEVSQTNEGNSEVSEVRDMTQRNEGNSDASFSAHH
jgi:dynein assembly factor 3